MNTIKNRHVWGWLGALIMLGLLTNACVRQIEFDLPIDPPLPVIQGAIHAGPGPYKVQISLSSPYGAERVSPVENAILFLEDANGRREAFIPVPEEAGSYICPGDSIQGVVGGTYHISGLLPDGTPFHSIPETIPFPTRMTDLEFAFKQIRTVGNAGFVKTEWVASVEVSTQFPLLEQGPFIRWATDEMWILREVDQGNPLISPKSCYITGTSDPQRVDLFNGQRIKTSFWDAQEVISRPLDYTFLDLHYFNVYQYTTSAKALEYWESVNRIANQQGSIFDAPPAIVTGNMKNSDDPEALILGYFEAVTIDTARTFTTPFDLPNVSIPGLCEFRGGFSNYQLPPACFNCLEYKDATLDRPDYLD